MSILSSFWRLASSGKFLMARIKKSSCLAAIILSLCLLITSRNANATNFFNWGMESLRPNFDGVQSGSDAEFHGGTTQDCTVSHTGSCSMKLVVIGNDGGNQGMGADLLHTNSPYFDVLSGKSIYYRWWMKIQPGFSWGSGSAKTKTSRTSVGSSLFYTGYMFGSGFVIGECDPVGCTLNNGGSNGSDTNLKIPYNVSGKNDGVWHEYIIRIKPNTNASCTAPTNCDAEFEAFVDGLSVGKYNGYKLVNQSGTYYDRWGGWMVYPYFQLGGTASDGGTIYLDDFSTDDSWNSLIGGSPITSPNPPTNLRIQ